MLSRLKSFLTSGSKAVESSTARGAGRVNRRTSYQHNAAPPPQYFSPPPGATAGATGAGAPASKFDTAKIFRTGFLVLGAGFFLSRFLTDPNNPDSLMSRALNPRGRSRYVLKVEKLDDTIASYQSAFIGAERGMKPALLSLARYQVAKKMGVDVSEACLCICIDLLCLKLIYTCDLCL